MAKTFASKKAANLQKKTEKAANKLDRINQMV